MNPSATSQSVAQPFRGDATVRWSCRQGEYVLWVGTDSFLTADRASSWAIRDFWQMRDGNYLTITSRWADLPVWFELHPLEVAGRAVTKMMKRLDAGHKPTEVMDGPNLCRTRLVHGVGDGGNLRRDAGLLGRETKGEVVLASRLRAALERLNPALPPVAITAAVDELTRDRSAMSRFSEQMNLKTN